MNGDPERVRTGSKKELRTDIGVFRYVTTRLCRRKFLAVHNDDHTSNGQIAVSLIAIPHDSQLNPALDFSNNFCCDSEEHNKGFDINYYFLAPVTRLPTSPTSVVSKPPRAKYRSVPDRKELGVRLTNWRQHLHSSSHLLRQWPAEWILDDNDIVLLARAKPKHFAVSSDVTEFLGESEEWGRKHALDILTLIVAYDRELEAARAIAKAKKKEENKRKAAEKRIKKRQAKLAEIAAAAAEEGMDPESEEGESEEEVPGMQSEEELESDNGQEVQPNEELLHFRPGAVTQSQVTRFRIHQDPSPTSSRSSSRASASRPPTPSVTIANRRPRPPHSPAAQPKTPPPPSKRPRTQLDDTTNTYELRSGRRHR
jgi:hypothetical protein